MRTLPSYSIPLYLVLLTLILLSRTAAAQAPAPSDRISQYSGGFGHLSLSGEQLNLADLNKFLSSDNYGALDLFSASFGGGGFFALNNFLIGGGGAWFTNSRTHNLSNAVEVKGGYGHFDFGYILYAGKRFLVYPCIGIGGGGYDITISKKNAPDDFSQQLNSPEGAILLNAGGWMTNAQITYQYFFRRHGKEGFFIGLKAGYKYSPSTWQTTAHNKVVHSAPKINMNGAYITLFIGGGNLISN